jgi:hypothetical protein
MASNRPELLQLVPIDATPKGFWTRFEQICHRLECVRQRNVVEVCEAGISEGMGYVATEALPGRTLGDAMRHGMGTGAALYCLAQLCMALDALHSEGISLGTLHAEDVVLRDGNVPVVAGVGQIQRALQVWPAGPIATPSQTEQVAEDFQLLGSLLTQMLLSPTASPRPSGRPQLISTLTPALPPPIAALQPLVSRLVGKNGKSGFTDGAEIVAELLSLKDRFPFSPQHLTAESQIYGALA